MRPGHRASGARLSSRSGYEGYAAAAGLGTGCQSIPAPPLPRRAAFYYLPEAGQVADARHHRKPVWHRYADCAGAGAGGVGCAAQSGVGAGDYRAGHPAAGGCAGRPLHRYRRGQAAAFVAGGAVFHHRGQCRIGRAGRGCQGAGSGVAAGRRGARVCPRHQG